MLETLKRYFDDRTAIKIESAIKTGLPVIIDGIQGPTGKSTLCEYLRGKGFSAIEKWCADKNKGDDNSVNIVITLNKYIR